MGIYECELYVCVYIDMIHGLFVVWENVLEIKTQEKNNANYSFCYRYYNIVLNFCVSGTYVSSNHLYLQRHTKCLQ